MIIVYCETCGIRVAEKDLQYGSAIRVEERVYHATCAPAAGARRTSGKQTQPPGTLIPPVASSASVEVSGAKSARFGSKRETHPLAGSARSEQPLSANARVGPPKIVLIGGVALVVGVLVILAFAAGKEPDETKSSQPSQTTMAAPAKGIETGITLAPILATVTATEAPAAERLGALTKEFEDRREQWAEKLLDEAKAQSEKNPKSMRDKLKVLVRTYRSTPAGGEAEKILAELKEPDPVAVTDEKPVTGNLLNDGGFESGNTSRWWKWGSGGLTDKEARTGKFCARVNSSENGGLAYKVSNLTPGANYVLTAWLKNGMYAGIKEYGGAERKATIPNSEYMQASISFALGKDQTTATVFVHKSKGGQTGYADDIVLLQLGAEGADELTTPVPNKPVAPPVADDPASKAPLGAAQANLAYAKTLSDVCVLLSKDGVEQALTRLEKAKTDPLLTSMAGQLLLEREFAADFRSARRASLDGAALLVDKRPFVFKKTDGKDTAVGKGTPISVTGVKDDAIQIEESHGGGRVQASISLEALSQQTRFDLMRLGLPASAESSLKLAYQALVLRDSGSGHVAGKEIQAHLETARKAQGAEARIRHLAERLEAGEKEKSVETEFKKTETLLKDKKWDELKTFMQSFTQEFAGTLAFERLAPAIEKIRLELENQSHVRPGLWASHWSGDGGNKFKKKILARPETTISQDFGAGSPDKAVPGDNFGIIWAGTLRVENEGKYKAIIRGDDGVALWLDGVQAKNEAQVFLTKGDKEIKIVFTEGGGGANLTVRLKAENGPEADLPATALFHDVRNILKYEQK